MLLTAMASEEIPGKPASSLFWGISGVTELLNKNQTGENGASIPGVLLDNWEDTEGHKVRETNEGSRDLRKISVPEE